MPTPKITYRPHLEALFPYPAGRPIEEVQREFGIKRVVKLASNENPLGPSPKALVAARKALAACNQYPEGGAYYLRHALAKKLRVQPEQLIFGNGTDELIILAALTFLEREENMIVSDKAFVRYRMAAALNGSPCKIVPMRYSEPGPGRIFWKHDLAAMAAAVDEQTRMICLSNPNNPLGSWVERAEFEKFLAAVPERVLIFYDEAYFEYAKGLRGQPNGLDYLEQYPNLLVSRTFSKAYGLAGLRVGYAIGHPDLIEGLERVRPPFNVNRVAQAAAVAALDDAGHVQKSLRANRAGMKELEREIVALGMKYVPSRANFLTIDTGCDSNELSRALMREGVIVRPLAGFGMPRLIRVTIGKPAENRRFARKLKIILSQAFPRK